MAERVRLAGALRADAAPDARRVRHAPADRVVVKPIAEPHTTVGRIATRPGPAAAGAPQRVSHPSVACLFDLEPGTAPPPVRGESLRALLQGQGALSLARIRGLAWQLLDGLAALHAAGIVHADLRCDTIVIDVTATGDRLMILDFGLTRASTARSVHGEEGAARAPEYLAPELIRGLPPTRATDLYAAAIVIYELIVGMTPFAGRPPLEVLDLQLVAPIEFPREVRAAISPEVERVLLRALAKAPERRFPDARSFAIELDRAIAKLPGGERPARTTEEVRPPPARDRYRDVEIEEIRRRRLELDEAFALGGADPIIAAALALADALITDGQLSAAVYELESVLAIQLARRGRPPGAVWRIEALVAALYERLGNSIRARRAAMDAHTHAVRAGCKVAERSTRALLHRLLGGRRPQPSAD